MNPNIARINSVLANSLSPVHDAANSTAITSALTNSSAVTNGLAFTGGLGFSTRQPVPERGGDGGRRTAWRSPAGPASAARPSATTAANNGLAFTNGTGFSTPAGNAFNSATNGLAFTNGTGFSLPDRVRTTRPTTAWRSPAGSGSTTSDSNPFL